MSLILPLYYSSRLVNQALVDNELGQLSLLHWGLRLPDGELERNDRRTDIIAARLAQPDDLIHRCHPCTQLVSERRSYTLNLAKVAVRPELVPMLIEFKLTADPELYNSIRDLATLVQRIIFLNRSRVDCRNSNLREVLAQMEQF